MAKLIGLDVGTTGCKAVVFSDTGAVLGSSYREYGIQADAFGKAEQDPELVWSLCQVVLKASVEAVGDGKGSEPIVALGLSVQGDAIIPLDDTGSALFPAILGMDYRSASQAEACASRFGGRDLFLKTGMRPHAMNSLCKAIWYKDTYPELWKRTARIVTYSDYISSRLLGLPSGEPYIDRTMASRTMAWNRSSQDWDDALLGDLGLDRSYFSKAVFSGTPLGTLDKKLALDCGIPANCLFVAGGHD